MIEQAIPSDDKTQAHRQAFARQLFLQSLRETELLTPGQLDDYYQPQIARLIDHAWREVPFYQERLAPFVTYGVLDMRSWKDIPLLRYGDIQANADALNAEHVPPPADKVVALNPAANAPFRSRSRMAETAAECERERFYELMGLNLSAPLAVLEDGASAGESTGWSITIARSRRLAGDTGSHPEVQMRWLADSGARQLRLTVTTATQLLKADSAPSLDCVVVVGDVLLADLRGSLAKRFGAKVCHLIERPVLGPLAADDGNGRLYRVVVGSTVVELVGQDGKPVAPGTVGELVVTPLYEYASPLLRLATGVRALASEKPAATLGIRWIGPTV